MLQSTPFKAPQWAAELSKPPTNKLRLGHYPTPIYPFGPPGLPEGVKMYIKRDDFSGMETSGNKIRKLEFLLQDALDKNADCIVTCGGVQSNHCRATAAAGRMFGLDSYLLLHSTSPDKDPGLVGNLMVDRLMNATIIQLSTEEYGRYGPNAMIERTCERLRNEGRNPYAIPLGGSSGLGTWGLLEAIDELHSQLHDMEMKISDIAFACGSGGTATGVGLGSYLYAKYHEQSPSLRFDKAQLPAHAYIVIDDPEHFFNYIDNVILPEMGAPGSLSSREFLQISDAQGAGYAQSTTAELEFVIQVAQATGIMMDPVYSGKALYHLIREINECPEKFYGQSILFIHTGGHLGLYECADKLLPLTVTSPNERFRMD